MAVVTWEPLWASQRLSAVLLSQRSPTGHVRCLGYPILPGLNPRLPTPQLSMVYKASGLSCPGPWRYHLRSLVVWNPSSGSASSQPLLVTSLRPVWSGVCSRSLVGMAVWVSRFPPPNLATMPTPELLLMSSGKGLFRQIPR